MSEVYPSGEDLVRAYMHSRNTAGIEEMRAFFSDDMIVHFPVSATVSEYHDANEFADSIVRFREVFSGWQEEVVELWGTGDRVVCRAIERGKHVGDYNGIAATNRTVEMLSTTVFRVSGTHIQEQWYMFDAMILMQQLGVEADFLEEMLFPERFTEAADHKAR